MQALSTYLARPNMFITFVNIEKLGINPQSQHTSTPVGIYAYPLREIYEMMENKMVPFASDRKYICVFEAQGTIVDLQKYSHDDYERDVGELAEQWHLLSQDNEDFAMSMLVSWEEEMLARYSSPGEALWRLVSRVAGRAERLYDKDSMIISNSIYRKLGYDGFLDINGSIIHAHEPTQAVFMTKSACRVVEFLINDHLEGIPAAFPKRGEKKIKGLKLDTNVGEE